jgi:fluoride ion exporter CrcB/FEX
VREKDGKQQQKRTNTENMDNSVGDRHGHSPHAPNIPPLSGNGDVASEDHSPLNAVNDREASQHNTSDNSGAASSHEAVAAPTASPPKPYTAEWSPYLVLVYSCLSVAAAGLGGNAVRFAVEKCFVTHPFFAKYDYIEPNSIGSFIMGLGVTLLPPETHLPLSYRAVCVGFCGSFTTFSTWMVKVMVQNTAGDAFEHLFLGATMPIVFFVWGRDLGKLLRWCCAELLHCPWESWTAHRSLLRAIDFTVFVLLVVAAVLTPVLVQVYVNKGRVRVISTDDIRMVVLAPIGAVLRFLLSFYLNKLDCVAQFPIGTLVANLIAVTLSIILFNMQVLHPSNAWLVIVQQGINGALSTVSSLVNELAGFYGGGRIGFSYVYGIITVGVSVFIGGIGRPQMYRRTVS